MVRKDEGPVITSAIYFVIFRKQGSTKSSDYAKMFLK